MFSAGARIAIRPALFITLVIFIGEAKRERDDEYVCRRYKYYVIFVIVRNIMKKSEGIMDGPLADSWSFDVASNLENQWIFCAIYLY